MVEDNKNNDTKEELKTSSDDKNMDIQQTDENKDLMHDVDIFFVQTNISVII